MCAARMEKKLWNTKQMFSLARRLRDLDKDLKPSLCKAIPASIVVMLCAILNVLENCKLRSLRKTVCALGDSKLLE
jgi:hypothetical protein